MLVVLFQYPIARWAGRRSGRLVLAAGSVLQGLSLTMLLPVEHVGILVVAVVVLTLGEMLIAPGSSAMAANLAPPQLRGSYQGVMNLAWAATAGPALLIGLWLVGAGQGALVLALALPLGALGGLAFLALPAGAQPRKEKLETRVPAVPSPVRPPA